MQLDRSRSLSRRGVLKTAGVGVTAAAVSTSSTAESQSSWSTFGYDPQNTGYSKEATEVHNPKVAWRFETQQSVNSSPAVYEDTVYTGSGDGRVYAIDATTGAKRWDYRTAGGVSSSPTITADTVYVGSSDATVYALSRTDGSERWRYRTGAGVFSSPTVVDDTLVVGSLDGAVYALDTANGEVRWTHETNGEVWATPAVADGVVFVGSRDRQLYALAVDSGTKQWDRTTGGPIDSPPAIRGDTVYVGSLDGSVYAFTLDGRQRWTAETDGKFASSPAVTTDSVYIGNRNGKVYAFTAGDGTRRWTVETGGRVFSSPAVTTGRVYVGSGDGRIYAINATTGRTRWDVATGDGIFSSPAIADATLYIGSTDGNLYAIADAATPSSLPGPLTQQELALALLGGASIGVGGLWWFRRRRGGTSDGPDASSPSNGTPRATAANLPDLDPAPAIEAATYNRFTDRERTGTQAGMHVYRATIRADGEYRTAILREPAVTDTLELRSVGAFSERVETWAKLDDHNHIVSVYGYGQDPIPWVAHEAVDGPSLNAVVGTVGIPQAVWIALGVTKAVRHAHQRGVYHGALQPAVCQLRQTEDAWPVPKIAGWERDQNPFDNRAIADRPILPYAAPEQLRGSRSPDDVTDVYQLGAVLYELFTGQPPFEGSSQEIKEAIKHESPTSPDEVAESVPPAIADPLQTCLAKRPADRYDSTVYLRDTLSDLLKNYLDVGDNTVVLEN